MNPAELAEAKRKHDIEMTVSAIAYTLALTPDWNANTLETIAELIAEVAPHPGEVQPGEYESYVNELMIAQLPVSWGMIEEAQAQDTTYTDTDTDTDN